MVKTRPHMFKKSACSIIFSKACASWSPRCTPGCSAGGQHTIVRCSAGEVKYHWTWTWDPSWLLHLRGLEFQSSSRRFGPGSMSRNLDFRWSALRRFRSFYPVVNQDIWFCFDTLKLRSKCQAGQSVAKAKNSFVLSCTWLICTIPLLRDMMVVEEGKHDGKAVWAWVHLLGKGVCSNITLGSATDMQLWTHSESCRENHSGRTPGLYWDGDVSKGHVDQSWSIGLKCRCRNPSPLVISSIVA